MSSTLDQPLLRRAHRYGLIAAVFLCVWATRAWTVGRFGSDLPYWDQWAKEGEMFFQPWFERHEFWHNLFVPHNEHRIAPSLALNFLLMRASGDQWDARVQCVANAALWAALAAALAAWSLRRFPTVWAFATCGLIVAVAAPPIAWENVLGGFQSCFSFVTIASLLAMAGLLLAPPLSLRWFGGIVAAAVAVVSLGSGMLVAAPVGVVAALQWRSQVRDQTWRQSSTGVARVRDRRYLRWVTLVAAVVIGGIGWWMRPQAPWHAALHTHSILQSLDYAARCLAWPLYGSPWLAAVFWAPWVVFAVRCVIEMWAGSLRPADNAVDYSSGVRALRPHSIQCTGGFVLALGLWVLAQVAAVSFARAGGSAEPAPRYGDIFALGLVANAFALALLGTRGSYQAESIEASSEKVAAVVPTAAEHREPVAIADDSRQLGASSSAGEIVAARSASVARAYAGAWFALVIIAMAFSTVLQVRGGLTQRKADTDTYERNVHSFVLTDDYAHFDAQQPHLPFPFTDWLARMIRNASLRRILPSSIRAPIAVAGLSDRPVQSLTGEPAIPAPKSRDGLPPLAHRATRLVHAGETWQSEIIGPTTGYWKIETAGDVGLAGAALEIVSSQTGRVLGRVAPSKPAGNSWRAAYVRAPRERAYLRARVASPAHWIAFSEPAEMSTLSFWTWRFTQQAQWVALATVAALIALLWEGRYAPTVSSADRSRRKAAPTAPKLQRAAKRLAGDQPLPQSASAHDRVFGLDALRATAILCVVLAHGGLQFVLGDVLQKLPMIGKYAGWSSLVGHGGAVGVEIFFVLSGFLIGGILLRSADTLATPEGLFGFYLRRWFRTLPLFALALGVNVLFEQYVRNHALTPGEIAGHGFFLRNFSHISLTFFPESWSLAVEEWFYLLFPAALFLTLVLSRQRFGRVFFVVAIVFFVFSTTMRIWGAMQPGATWAGTARCTVIYRFDALMCGVVAAWASLNFPAAWRAYARALKWVGLLIFFGGYAFWWTYHVDGPSEAPDTFFARTFRFTVMPLGLALLLPALSQWTSTSKGLLHRATRRIALWSYALYLVHWPFFQIAGGDWSKPWQAAAGAWFFVGKVLIAIAIAAVLHVAFEAPAMRLRNRLRPSQLAGQAEPAGAVADVR